MKITPKDKKAASPLLLFGGAFILSAGTVALCAPFLRGDYWLLIVCVPFTLVAWWIGRTLLGAYLNSAFSTTEVEPEGDRLIVRNRPFGRSFELAYADIRSCVMTDIMNPKACLEILLTDRRHRNYQVCAFRETSPVIKSLLTTITTKAEQVSGGNGGQRA